jgi:antibiotic biosynthesis monooxygenase (ABM) superfamily enzyme
MTSSIRYVRVVSLWVRPGQEAAFEAFERAAARVMARYGGRIDHAVRLEASEEATADDAPFEVHIVSFPDKAAFEAYINDPQVLALRAERDRIISRTVFAAGREAGPY